MKALLLSLLLAPGLLAQPEKAELKKVEHYAAIIAALTDPAKLASLKGKRAATPRLRRVMYWLKMGEREGIQPANLIDLGRQANRLAESERTKLLRESLLRNYDILGKLGCSEVAGIGKLRTGNAPTITKGPYKGELATVDHIIPRSVAPELEFLPDTLNQRKGDKVGDRQVQLARKWHKAGVLSKEGLGRVVGKQKTTVK